MARRKSPRILPLVLVLAAIAIAVAVLISLARAIFLPSDNSKNDKDTSQSQTLNPTKELLNTESDRSVSLVASGPIVAQENFRSYQIIITPSERKLILYEGYLGTVVDSQSLDNNVNAYGQFVGALNLAGLTAAKTPEDLKDNRQGVCAIGEYYQFDLLKSYNKDLVFRYWSSTCPGSSGTLKANAEQIIDLFVRQIPDARTILKNINVYVSK